MLNKNLVPYSLNIQKFLGKLITDLETRERFFNNTEQTLVEAGLTPFECELLANSGLAHAGNVAAIPGPEVQILWGS